MVLKILNKRTGLLALSYNGLKNKFVSRASSSFGAPPSPMRLPKKQQEEFEELQKKANMEKVLNGENETTMQSEFAALKTIPEFEGDVNPKTGEIGGPKQDPLRHGDYSFNGRVTDF